ncbi:MAG: AI-2E family transporter [Deltaproteobacteria bacterium]|nr:AI-2E family transporter [Deltaproteobacteria bacterium]
MRQSSTETTEAGKSQANVRDLLEYFSAPIDIRSLALTGLFLLSVLYSLYFARVFFLPIVLTLLLNLLLSPAVRFLKAYRVPQALGAGIIIFGLLLLLGYGIYRLAEPAGEWMQNAPKTLNQVRSKLRTFTKPVENVQETTEKIEKMTSLGNESKKAVVELKKPGLGETVFSGTQEILLGGGITVVLLYFLLASGDLFLLKLVKVLPTLKDKKRAVETCREIEKNISNYLGTITLINLGLGIAIGVGTFLIGLPNPVLWGVVAAFLNFIPYLGALLGIIIVAGAAIVTLDDPVRIMSAPAMYFGLNVIEAYWVTPMVLSRTLALNPVVILIWLVFWGWIWGVFGALLAVPMLAIVKIICDRFQPLAAIGEFLGNESRAPAL